MLRVQMIKFLVFLGEEFLNSVDFHLSYIELVLILMNLKFDLLVGVFLGRSYSIQLERHFFNLLSLRMVDIGLATDFLMALLYLKLRRFKLFCHIAASVLRFRKLYFYIAE